MGYERAKRCAVSSEEKGETIIHGRASRVSPLKNIIPSGNSSRVCKKNLYTCLKCNLTANERGKRGCVTREWKRKIAIAERDDDYYPFRSSVDSARFLLDSGGGGNPRSKSFSNRYVFSHLPWKDIMRFHEEYKSYEIYCRTSLCLSTSVSTFWRLGIKKNRTINCIF